MQRIDLLGVEVSVGTMDDAASAIMADARAGKPTTVEFLAVNNLVETRLSASFGAGMRTFDYVFADGMPIAWLARSRVGRGFAERVTARELMDRCCAEAARSGIPVFLYGTTARTLAALSERLRRRFPDLVIAGSQPSAFRPLDAAEDDALVAAVNASGARLLFVALGCPLQETFVAQHKGHFSSVQLCVGSAFKAHAGEMPVAPRFVQRLGLEWLYRLAQEPRRLWKRYLFTNSYFLWLLLREAVTRSLEAGARRCAALVQRS
jgi:exopolysaccharide biosynthesis WecB/TagA/CpsF family protein